MPCAVVYMTSTSLDLSLSLSMQTARFYSPCPESNMMQENWIPNISVFSQCMEETRWMVVKHTLIDVYGSPSPPNRVKVDIAYAPSLSSQQAILV